MKSFRFVALLALGLTLSVIALAPRAHAQDREVPYWASLHYDEVRMRVGPSQRYPIEWIYKRKPLPVKVVRLREGWRLVQDPEGTRGWIASSQLTTDRGAIVIGQGLAEMREGPEPAAALKWRAEPGVVGRLLRCRAGWCEFDVSGRVGWVQEDRLWGAGLP